MNSFEKMLEALELLNHGLAERNTTVDLTIVGSMAIYLNNEPIARFTEDIDFVGYDPDERFLQEVAVVAQKLDLPEDWINDKADTISPLPDNLENDTIMNDSFSNIKLKIIKRKTIIKMKVYAYFMRQAQKDLDDLYLLKPKELELEGGVRYIEKTIIHHHGNDMLKKEKENIERFKQYLFKSFL